MRICVFALAAICIAQPASAREPAHKRSHQMERHYAHHHAARHHKKHRAVGVRRQPVESGYATPQTFARTDAVDTPLTRDTWQPAPARNFASFSAEPQPRMRRAAASRNTELDSAIARHAAANGLPVDLVHRVVKRESNYNPRASSKGNIGLMQIRHQTARGIGYTGSASGLLDAETNLTYAVRYLAGAYRAAGGNQSRAVALYASGYHGRGVRVARAPQAMEPQQQAWGWEVQQSSGWQSAQVALQRPDAMTEAAPRARVRHRHRR